MQGKRLVKAMLNKHPHQGSYTNSRANIGSEMSNKISCSEIESKIAKLKPSSRQL